MRVVIYAGYLIDAERLDAWSQAQTDVTYVRCREEHPTDAIFALRHYLRIKQPDFPVQVDLLPLPKGDITGRTTDDNWYAMLYLHHGDYEVRLNRFADWHRYEQGESDTRLLGIIENIGIPDYGDVKWNVAAWVGTIGLFYDFSPKVIEEIYERMEAYMAAKAQRAVQ